MVNIVHKSWKIKRFLNLVVINYLIQNIWSTMDQNCWEIRSTFEPICKNDDHSSLPILKYLLLGNIMISYTKPDFSNLCASLSFFYLSTNLFYPFLLQYCTLGRLSHDVGWKYQDVVATLEAKRKVKSDSFHKKKVSIAKIKDQVKKDPKVVKRIANYQKIIEGYGYA